MSAFIDNVVEIKYLDEINFHFSDTVKEKLRTKLIVLVIMKNYLKLTKVRDRHRQFHVLFYFGGPCIELNL
ncbi:CLUMA_CG015675, isoform A [Clunio marinus]|uniref:CLUMA_CG015675, isoform A n=1 Tax=Clunio marinus TaxID=568069 RepID=A0A1J1INW5_9DIPT|nr:CLUMA_CG015675, isoform A [Clunio marinus]